MTSDIRYWTSGVDGLVLFNDKRQSKFGKSRFPWRIVHEQSGTQLCPLGWKKRVEATGFCASVKDLTDWTKSGEEISDPTVIEAFIRKFMEKQAEYYGVNYQLTFSDVPSE